MKIKFNILIIILDTLRRDTLYDIVGNTKAFREIIKDGVVYPNVIAPSPWTTPSHMSILTGKYPSEHKVHKDPHEDLSELANKMKKYNSELLDNIKELGYHRASLHANMLLSKGTGFESGFDLCESFGPFARLHNDMIANSELFNQIKQYGFLFTIIDLLISRQFPLLFKTFKENLSFLRELKAYKFPENKGAKEIIEFYSEMKVDRPTFTLMNFMESHEPYTKVPFLVPTIMNREGLAGFKDLLGINKIKNRYIKKAKVAYTKSVKVLDMELEKLIKFLKDSSQYDDSLIVITADHGQAFKEKGYFGHQIFLYDEIIEIPLIIKYPNSEKFPVTGEYQTLTDMSSFIFNWAKGEKFPFPSRDVVFSEAYGLGLDELNNLSFGKIHDNNKVVIRKAVFKDGCKMVVDGANSKIEEFTCKGQNVKVDDNLELARDMLEELEIFVGMENFEVPKI